MPKLTSSSSIKSTAGKPTVIKKTKKKEKEEETCAICMENFDNPEENGIKCKIGRCRHRYHKPCIEKWAERKNTCPVCCRRFKTIKPCQKKDGPTVTVAETNPPVHNPPPMPDHDTFITEVCSRWVASARFRAALIMTAMDNSDPMRAMTTDVCKLIVTVVNAMFRNNELPPFVDGRSVIEATNVLDQIITRGESIDNPILI